jgi:hypothetical protein
MSSTAAHKLAPRSLGHPYAFSSATPWNTKAIGVSS